VARETDPGGVADAGHTRSGAGATRPTYALHGCASLSPPYALASDTDRAAASTRGLIDRTSAAFAALFLRYQT